ncbi:MAG: transglycosylase SLT domain-containing protein [Pyrinomonadaceae bacterium]
MKTSLARIVALLILAIPAFCQQSDVALRRVVDRDSSSRNSTGQLETLSAAEHLLRAETYSSNRLFPQARAHWQKVFDNYPEDPGVPKALFGTARSFMWEREYQKAVDWFDRLIRDFPNTKDGREGLAFKGASLVRLGKNLEAAKIYEQYVVMFPSGERIESAHLNIIDAYRDAKEYDEANNWVERTTARFGNKPAEVNARHAKLRMEIYRENWNEAARTADTLLAGRTFAGSMAWSDEVRYLKAFALEKANRRSEASSAYAAVGSSDTSYYAGLAEEKRRGGVVGSMPASLVAHYPIMYRTEILREARKRKIDSRFVLAIMKQESVFKSAAKSPAGARGLLQLVYDTAIKYNKKAGYPSLQPDDLYNPAVNIAIGSVYIAELKDEFDGLYEAVAASYNAGEDNAARWLNRTRPKEPGIFASEVGFAETKNYVFKVMNNYRNYRSLYTEDLQRR